LSLHPGDAIDIEPVLALKILYGEREFLIVDIAMLGIGRTSGERIQAAAQPANFITLHP